MLTDKKAKTFIRKYEEYKRQLKLDKRFSADYWNGDDWGSISGHRDAQEWYEDQLSEFVMKYFDNGA